jgi:tetratricopeptide (TPR) repeat protein
VEDFTRALQLVQDADDVGETYYRRGIAYLGQSNYAEAMNDFDQAVDRLVPAADMYQRRAVTAAALNRWQDAIADVQRALALQPEHPEALQSLEKTYHAQAIEAFSRQIESGQPTAALYRDRGLSRKALKLTKEAQSDFELAIQLDDTDVETHIGLGKILADKEKHGPAIEHFTRGLDLAKDHAEAYFGRGLSLSKTGKDTRAFKDLSKAIDLDPESVGALLARAELLTRLGRFTGAEVDLNNAYVLSPGSAEVYLSRGRFFDARKESDKAIVAYDKAIGLCPNFSKAYFHRGEAYRTKRDLDRAIADFEKAIRLDPKLSSAYCSRGLAMAQQGRFEQAIIELTKATGLVRYSRRFAEAYEVRAKVYYSIGRYEEAVADFSTVIRLEPDNHRFDRTFCGRGLALIKLKKFEDAEKDFAAALELNPRSANAQRYLQWIRGDRQEQLPELRDPKTHVARRVPSVVMHGFEVSHDRRWDAVALWDQWIMCDSGGQEYGPVDKQTLDTWFAEGRLNFGTRLLRIDQKKWLLAGDVYPDLAPRKSRAAGPSEPAAPSAAGVVPADELPVQQSSPEAPPADAFSFGDEDRTIEEDDLPDIKV